MINVDKLMDNFEFYYKYSKQLEKVNDLQKNYIQKLESNESAYLAKIKDLKQKEINSTSKDDYTRFFIKLEEQNIKQNQKIKEQQEEIMMLKRILNLKDMRI